MNRRDFFKTTTLALPSFALFGLTPTQPNEIQPTIFKSKAVLWIEENVKINTTTPLKLNEEQIRFINHIEKTDLSLYFRYPNRQSGYTTVTAAYLFYRMIHDHDSNFLIICNRNEHSNEFRNIISDFYNGLPNQLKYVKNYSCDRRTMNINSNKLIITDYDRSSVDVCGYDIKLAFAQDFGYSKTGINCHLDVQYNVDKLTGYSYNG